MKTKTIEAKTLPYFETLDELFAAAKPHQVTGQEVLNGRCFVYGEWQEIELSTELRQSICNDIAENLGGRSATKSQVKNVLRWGRPQHWGLARVLLQKYGDSPAYFRYCAGQDQSWETKEIRRSLTK